MFDLTRARRQDGFTIAGIMLAMLALMSLTAAAFAAAGGELHLGQRNVDEKRAYAAAEAGVAYYLQKLAQDNDYWTRCTNDPTVPTTQNPVNQTWRPATADEEDPRTFAPVPGSGRTSFAVELLSIKPTCIENDNASMINSGGTLQIRSTGVAGPPNAPVRRSVVAALRRKGFLDYVYFTDFETLDPGQQKLSSPNDLWGATTIKRTPNPATAALSATPVDSVAAWAADPAGCTRPLRPNPSDPADVERDDLRYPGTGYFDPPDSRPLGWYRTSEGGAAYDIRCSTIRFGSTDAVNGPFHSNDSILVCGSVPFGRDAEDRIEFYAYKQECTGTPVFSSTPVTGVNLEPLSLPQTNAELKPTTYAPYVYTGKTEITLNGTTMTVKRSDGTTVTQSLPSNGLIFVRDHPTLACPEFDVLRPYAAAPNCGDVYIKGTYAKSLTITAERDVVVSGDIKQTVGSDSVIGLIAEHYVRVEHRMTGSTTALCPDGTTNAATGKRTIEAAMLALNNVFTVDNYQCGAGVGTLEIRGAIGQKYRGPVKRGSSGYVKDYIYDNRLRYRSPPYFLTPVESAWRIMRISEQAPAR